MPTMSSNEMQFRLSQGMLNTGGTQDQGMSAMLRLSLAVKESKESMYSVLNSLGSHSGSTRSRIDKRLGGGSAAMLAKLSSNQLSRNDRLLHSAATTNGFSSFDDVVRDAIMLDAALGSKSDFSLPSDSRLASLALGTRSIAGGRSDVADLLASASALKSFVERCAPDESDTQNSESDFFGSKYR